MASPPSAQPLRGRFAALLKAHMAAGTRPSGARGTGSWSIDAFAQAIGIGTRTVQNYRAGETIPKDISLILDAFFGNDRCHTEAREDFLAAFNQTRLATQDATTYQTLPAEFRSVQAVVNATENPRLRYLLGFAYIFTRIDQLQSGSWGTSVARWMSEVGKSVENFELNDQIGIEGGIETTALCVQALAQCWGDLPLDAEIWATRCREYLRTRQADNGSIGYRRHGFRDPTPVIESTYRHTAQAALILAELGSRGPQISHALRYITECLCPSRGWVVSDVLVKSAQVERYPGMLIASTATVLNKLAQFPRDWPIARDIDISRKTEDCLMSALALVDKEHYPLFRPYGRFDNMELYSFISILGLISKLNVSLIGDRVNDGLSTIFDLTLQRGEVPFSRGLPFGDFALTASLLSLLCSPSILGVLNSSILARAIEISRLQIEWLTEHFDRFTPDSGIFRYLQSGGISRIIATPLWTHVNLDYRQMMDLEKVVFDLQLSYFNREDPTRRQLILNRFISSSQVSTENLTRLLDHTISYRVLGSQT